MANITYRSSSTPTVPESTTTKGTPLTNLEVDANFKSINDEVALKATIAFVNAADNLKANSASPTFTDTPAAPTAAAGTNTTQLATTAHVFAERTNSAILTNKSLTQPIITNPENTELTLTDGATVNWNLNSGHVAKWTITATGRTFALPTNPKNGGQYVLFLSLDTPSTMTPTWNANILWPYGTAPDLTTSTNTVISLVWSSGLSKFLGSYTPGY